MAENSTRAKVVCVFCSADDKVPPQYKDLAFALGNTLATNGYILLSGGNNSGLMNSLNDGHVAANNNVSRYAAIPEIMRTLAVTHPGIPTKNIVWTDDVYDRLKTFHGMCDFVVVLPGGFGTLHELLDCLVLSQFGIIKKHIFLFNVDNFWDHLLAQFKLMVQKQTLYAKHLEHILEVKTIDDLMQKLQNETALELTQGFSDHYWK